MLKSRRIVPLFLVLMLVFLSAVGSAESADRVITINLNTATDAELADAVEQLKAEQRSRLKTTIRTEPSDVTVNKGATVAIAATVEDLPEGVSAGEIVWKSSDETIATYNKGKIKGIDAGNTSIICSTILSDGTEISVDCPVTVIVPVQSISVKEKKVSVMVSDTFTPMIEVKPQNATIQALDFSSSDESVIKPEANNSLLAVAPGKAEVTVVTIDGSNKSAKFSVEVTQKIGTAENAITFQDIPWLSDFKTVKSALISGGFLNGTYTSTMELIKADKLTTGVYLQTDKKIIAGPLTPAGHGYDRCTQVLPVFDYEINPQKTVGGYPIDRMSFTFAFDGEKTELVTVRLSLKTDNLTAAVKDMEDKLTTLYGKCVHGSSKSGKKQYSSSVWQGPDQSAVLIFVGPTSTSLDLYYGLLSPSAVFDECAKRLDSRPNNVDSSDTGGL